MKRYIPLTLATLAVLGLAACVTATPYQPMAKGEGYAEQKIESNRYKIRFAGNASTPKQTVENYLLYRSAEVAIANGYDYFVLTERDTDKETRYTQTNTGYGYGGGWWGWYPRSSVGVGVGTSVPSTEYEAQADILVFKGRKPEADAKAYDAREVKQNLEALVVRPVAGKA